MKICRVFLQNSLPKIKVIGVAPPLWQVWIHPYQREHELLRVHIFWEERSFYNFACKASSSKHN
jgi:hypothetical protein